MAADLLNPESFLGWLRITKPQWAPLFEDPDLQARIRAMVVDYTSKQTAAPIAGRGLYRIPAERMDRVKANFEKLAKAAERRGIDPPEIRVVRQTTEEVRESTSGPLLVRTYLDVEMVRGFQIPGEWSLVGTIDHTLDDRDEVAIAWLAPGAPAIPAEFLVGKPFCDHCRSVRKRNTTYIVAHGDKVERVGRTCMRAYLGDVGDRILTLAEIVRRATTELEESSKAPAAAEARDRLIDVLTIGAFYLRFGQYRSRREYGWHSTANTVRLELHPPPEKTRWDVPVTDADRAAAEAALDWARDLPLPEGEITNEYLYNIRSLAQCGFISERQFGLAVSILTAHRRETTGQRPREATRQTAPGLLPDESGVVLQQGLWRPKDSEFGLKKRGGDPPVNVLITFVHPQRVTGRTGDGYVLTWYRGSTDTDAEVQVGDTLLIGGRVTEHSIYQKVDQTRLTKVKVHERIMGPLAAAAAAAPPPPPPEVFTYSGAPSSVPRSAKVLAQTRTFTVFTVSAPIPPQDRDGIVPLNPSEAEEVLRYVHENAEPKDTSPLFSGSL